MDCKYDSQGNYTCKNQSGKKLLTDKTIETFARCSCVRDKSGECKVDIPTPIRHQQMSKEDLAKIKFLLS